MIELLFVYFILDYNAMMIGDNQSDSYEMCKQVSVLSNTISTDKVFKIAEKKWKNDRDKLDAFREYWKNIGNCNPK